MTDAPLEIEVHGAGGAGEHAAQRAVGSRMRLLGGALLAALSIVALPAGAEYPNWDSVADVKVIEVVTVDEDGDRRVAKVWFVLVDGVPYLRTNRSRWLDNLRRDPNLGLRIESHEYEAMAEEIPGDEIVEIVDRASAEKYGWRESVIHPFRIMKPDILKLGPRVDGD